MLSPALVAATPAGGGGGYTGPLDLVSGAVVAYGQRAMSSAKRGSALYTIRRSSDSTTQSFSSDATTGDAPTSAISAFIGGGNGFVTNWNDQSGNGHDVVQATAGNQPGWTAAGSNSKPAMTFDFTASQFLATAANVDLSSGSWTVFVVTQPVDASRAGDPGSFLGENTNHSGAYWDLELFFNNGPTQPNINSDAFDGTNEAGEVTDNLTTLYGSYHVVETGWVFGNNDIKVDGVTCGVQSSNDFTGPLSGGISFPLAIGSEDATLPAQFFEGEMAEILVYPSLLSDANRLALRQNIAAYYGITLS
jgi:hypothetical protein